MKTDSCSRTAVRTATYILATLAALAAPGRAAAPATTHPAACEVELFAEIKTLAALPPNHTWIAYVSDGDCLAKEAYILGRSPIKSGPKFMTEVIARWGADLTLCVVAEEAAGKPTTLYGKAKRTFHAEGRGEVVFHDLVVEVRKGPEHIFPKLSGTRPEPAK